MSKWLRALKLIGLFIVGGAAGLLLNMKDQVGFWLYGLPIALVLVLVVPLSSKNFISAVRERLKEDPQARTSIYVQLILSAWMLGLGSALFLWAYGFEGDDYGLHIHIGDSLPEQILLPVLALAAPLAPAVLHRRGVSTGGFDVLVPQTPKERGVWVLVSISAGITEEIAYRGFLTTYFYYLEPSMPLWLALVFSTIAFAGAHLYQGWSNMVGILLMGALFAYLYWATHSLFLSMVSHTLIDLAILARRPHQTVKVTIPEPAV
jgi:membrane protease YdiL (CAAX protease family)